MNTGIHFTLEERGAGQSSYFLSEDDPDYSIEVVVQACVRERSGKTIKQC